MAKRRRFGAEFTARAVLEDLCGVRDRGELRREPRLNLQVLARSAGQMPIVPDLPPPLPGVGPRGCI